MKDFINGCMLGEKNVHEVKRKAAVWLVLIYAESMRPINLEGSRCGILRRYEGGIVLLVAKNPALKHIQPISNGQLLPVTTRL